MTRLSIFVGALIAVAGCSGKLVSIRMDVPVGARVHMDAGYGTPARDFVTPFVGQFESGGSSIAAGYPLVFALDAEAARVYGIDHPVNIFARLNVLNPTDFSRTQVIRIAPSDEKMRALLHGEVSEIGFHVNDPNEGGHPVLANITMRMARF